ncbi:hypothetical protein INR49_031502, partial [Caranx melampygus]
MNELHSRYSDKGLVILGVPCNQLENGNNDEILRSLKYVRPGNGFEPKFPILEKVDEKLPFPIPVSPDGEPYKRYSRNFLTKDIEADIKSYSIETQELSSIERYAGCDSSNMAGQEDQCKRDPPRLANR